MLIALAIFSVVSLTAATLLYQAIEAQDVSMQYGNRMIDLDRGISRLSRDLMQYVPREVRDELGDFTDSLLLSPNQIEFTRRGWANPADHPRSDLQRVRYSVEGGGLMRRYWDVLDRAPESETHAQTLVEKVAWVSFEPVTASQVLRGDPFVTAADEQEPVIGIRVVLQVPGVGELARVIDLPLEAPPEQGEASGEPADIDVNGDSDGDAEAPSAQQEGGSNAR